jgi:hypothetical protein
MTMFMTKVWRWNVPVGPLQFGLEGNRTSAEEMLTKHPDALVLLVATKGENTAEADKGRLLGLIRPTLDRVRMNDFDLHVTPEDYDENGRYKWPFGLHAAEAWTLENAPLLDEISSRTFRTDAAVRLVELTAEEEARVLALPRTSVSVLQRRDHATGHGGGTGKQGAPAPSNKRVRIMHMRMEAAETYAMRIGEPGRNVYKIGWAVNPRTRERQFNQASMPALQGIRYQLVIRERWGRARDAFRMEQEILRRFQGRRHRDNQEIVVRVTESELLSVWTAAMDTVRKRVIAELTAARPSPEPKA